MTWRKNTYFDAADWLNPSGRLDGNNVKREVIV